MATGVENGLVKVTLDIVRGMHEDARDLAPFAQAAPEFIDTGDLSVAVHSVARWDASVGGRTLDITAVRPGIEPITSIDDGIASLSARWGRGPQVARYAVNQLGKTVIDQRFYATREKSIIPTRKLLAHTGYLDFPTFFDATSNAVGALEPASNYTKILISRGDDRVTASTYWSRIESDQTMHRIETTVGNEHLRAAYITTIDGETLAEIGYEKQGGFNQEQLETTASALGDLIAQYEAVLS